MSTFPTRLRELNQNEIYEGTGQDELSRPILIPSFPT